MEEREYSIRERKFARTKLGLMDAFLKRLKSATFDDISIREVCRDVEVAEKTFFNYFPEKMDVIAYYLQLRALKMIFKAQQSVPEGKCLARIQHVFSQMEKELGNDNVIYQIISVFLIQGQKPENIEISEVEKQMAFPECEGIETVPAVRLQDWIRECVKNARKHGELPAKTNIEDVVISLVTILGGTLLATRVENIEDRQYHYTRQVQFLWNGLGAKQ